MRDKSPTFDDVATAAEDTVYRIHTRHDRQAQGTIAFSSRRAGCLRLLAEVDAARGDGQSVTAARRWRSPRSGRVVAFPLRIGAATLLSRRRHPKQCWNTARHR